MKRVSLLCAFAIISAACATSADAGDLIRKTNGNWHISSPAHEGGVPTKDDLKNSRITVVDEQYEYTYYEIATMKGARQKIPTREIEIIYRGATDANYAAAEDALAEGDGEAALGYLASALKSPRAKWVPQYAMFARIDAYRMMNAADAADAALAAADELKAKFPRTRFTKQLIRARGEILLQMKGDIAGAKRVFNELGRLPGVGATEKYSVRYWLIYCDEYLGRRNDDRGMVEKCRVLYQKLLAEIESKKGVEEVASRARYGVGSCLNALGNFAEAIAYFEGIVARSKDASVLPGAYIGLGDAYFSTKKYAEARRAYLRVVVLWPESSFHAKALLRAGNCFMLVRDPDFKSNAARELNECKNRYPSSPEAKEAAQLLKRL